MSSTLAEVADPRTWDRETLRGHKLDRPRPIRGRTGTMMRADGGHWDWYYALDDTTREYVRREYTVPGGLGPDVLATMLGLDIDEAMSRWLEVVLANKGLGKYSETDEWDVPESVRHLEREVGDVNPRDMVGPTEIAQMLDVTLGAIRQWRRRGILPPPLKVVSGTPIWDRVDIDAWARDSGRVA